MLAALAAPVCAQSPQWTHETLHGRPAFVLSNGVIRVSVLSGGGHIAEVRFLQGDAKRTVNPMRVPHYQTIDPQTYDPAKHDALYGDSSHRWLSSGYMGHLLNFPVFGPPSSEHEIRNGLGNHGEAPIVEWKLVNSAATAESVVLDVEAELRRTRFRVGRRFTLKAQAASVHVEEWVENLEPYDRPVNWMQHATFGPPFAEPGKMFLDTDATRGEMAGAPGELRWPELAGASARPFQPEPRSGRYIAWRLDPARSEHFFTMYHSGFPVLIGYLFPETDNPWLGDWQENQRNTPKPWDGKAVARGIEFGSTPFAEGLRKSVERGKMFETATYRWIGGYERLRTEFTIFLAEIPADFRGAAGVSRSGPAIYIRETGAGRTIPVSGGR